MLSIVISQKQKKYFNRILKFALLLVSLTYIYFKLIRTDWTQLGLLFDDIRSNTEKQLLFLGVILLLPLNWGIEALKWQRLIGKLESISFVHALKSVLTGVSISIFTPNRAGEFAGKIFYLKKANKADALLRSMVGSLSQVLITFCLGLFALLHFLRLKQFLVEYNSLLIILVSLICCLSIFAFFKIRHIATTWNKWNFVQFFIPYHKQQFDINSNEIFRILCLSLLRFTVFTIQFYLLLLLFDFQPNLLNSLSLIVFYFFLISLIPTYALSELGVRGSVALLLFSDYGMDAAAIIASSLLLWLINLAIPALIGSAFIYQLRFFKTDDE